MTLTAPARNGQDVNIYFFNNDLLVAFQIDRITWQPDIIIIALPSAVCCWPFHRRRTDHRQRLHSYHTYSVTALRLSLPDGVHCSCVSRISLSHTHLPLQRYSNLIVCGLNMNSTIDKISGIFGLLTGSCPSAKSEEGSFTDNMSNNNVENILL